MEGKINTRVDEGSKRDVREGTMANVVAVKLTNKCPVIIQYVEYNTLDEHDSTTICEFRDLLCNINWFKACC